MTFLARPSSGWDFTFEGVLRDVVRQQEAVLHRKGIQVKKNKTTFKLFLFEISKLGRNFKKSNSCHQSFYNYFKICWWIKNRSEGVFIFFPKFKVGGSWCCAKWYAPSIVLFHLLAIVFISKRSCLRFLTHAFIDSRAIRCFFINQKTNFKGQHCFRLVSVSKIDMPYFIHFALLAEGFDVTFDLIQLVFILLKVVGQTF